MRQGRFGFLGIAHLLDGTKKALAENCFSEKAEPIFYFC